jgi:hypothetical protein
MTSNAVPEPSRSYRLLPQERFARGYLGISLMLLLLSAGLLIWNPPALSTIRPVLVVTAVIGALILTLMILVRQMSYVVCQMDELLIHLPFRSFVVPYAHVRSIRPDAFYRIFPPGEQPGWQRNVLSGVWSRTVVAVELNEFPWPRRQLRTWGGKYLLLPHSSGLVLPVRDWMALRTELDERYAAWRVRQRPDKRPKSPFWMT